MSIQQLQLQHFRNIAQADLCLHPEWNVIIGDNASGKTSLLESIYYLGRGRSFRAKNTASLIQKQANQPSDHEPDHCLVTGKIRLADQLHQLGIRRDTTSTVVRIDGQTAQSAVQLARYLPVLFVGPDIHQLITEGPAVRRRFMDWGVFHLNEQFIGYWQRYQSALKQRNALLRSHRSLPDNASGWHIALDQTAQEIDMMRDEFVLMLSEAFDSVMDLLLPTVSVSMRYRRGWPDDQSLSSILARDWSADQTYGHTRYGPHRAEIALKVEGKPAVERLSQGQRKLTAIALLVAQSYVFGETTTQRVALLIDDLAAELDAENVEKTLTLFQQLNAQCFLTATDRDAIRYIRDYDHQEWGIHNGVIEPYNV